VWARRLERLRADAEAAAVALAEREQRARELAAQVEAREREMRSDEAARQQLCVIRGGRMGVQPRCLVHRFECAGRRSGPASRVSARRSCGPPSASSPTGMKPWHCGCGG